jgi:starch-binding outer membrane protein, SusD/RagB family
LRSSKIAFEGKRWFDLVRQGFSAFQAALSKDPTATDVTATRMLWPIPQPQIDLNPALTQNPGY